MSKLPEGAPQNREEEWFMWMGGRSGGGYSDLGIVGADVGQSPVVASIDNDGNITGWDAVDKQTKITVSGTTLVIPD